LIVATGFEEALETEFLEAPFAVVGGDKGGDGGGAFGAVAVGFAVDDLLFEGAIEARDDAVGFGFASSPFAFGWIVALLNLPGALPAQPTNAPTSALTNLSVRTTLAQDQVLIVGATVSGGAKPILLRAAGPALNKFGLLGMTDPRIELYEGQVLVGSNNNWSSTLSATFERLGAFAFDAGSLDAAFAQSLSGGFTEQAQGTGLGVVLVEAYDSAGGVAPRMINLSARNFVGRGADILIAGFVLAGTGTKQLLIHAVGPTLATFGVPSVLLDPKLGVFSSGGVANAENANWSPAHSATFSAVGALPFGANSKDAARLITLTAGESYTVPVSGTNNTTSDPLIEIYEVFQPRTGFSFS